MKKVILVDGNNLLFRSYYATAYSGNIMRNSKGFPTNALYGFVNMLNKIINEEQPEYMMIAFDKGKTFRHEKYKDYKAGRSETPDELKEQFPKAKELCLAMGIKYFEIDNYEADDIIGTFAKEIDINDDFIGTIISSDKDLLQLISPDVDVKLLKQTDYIRMNEKVFMDTYGITPDKMIDLKGLMGDPSDHIPGVKGIGEKTALKLLQEYNNIEGIYEHIDSIKGATKEKLVSDRENAIFSKELATIYKDVPIDTNLNSIKYMGINHEYTTMLEDLEFYSFLKKVDIKKEDKLPLKVEIISDLTEMNIDDDYAMYLEINGNYHDKNIIGMGIYSKNKSFFVTKEGLLSNINFFNSDNLKYTYDLKKILVSFKYLGINLKNCFTDIMVISYLLNYSIKDDISYLMNNENVDTIFNEILFKKQYDIEIVAQETIKKAKYIYENKDRFNKELNDKECVELYNDIEHPMIGVLADMEHTGININLDVLNDMKEEIKIKMDLVSIDIYNLAGVEFNILSPKQLGDILFNKLGIRYPGRIKKDGFSTSVDILGKITDYPIVEKVLEYRMLSKLYSNYIVGLSETVKEDGKIHTTFNQTLTRTGRLSSTGPNLQNIPIRTEYGRKIRKAFIPSTDSLILSSDYSQIELRIFAHMSKATNLIEAFKHDMDIHTTTAMDIFNLPEIAIDKNKRRTAKAVNFGILYGISSFGLGEDLQISAKEAQAFIDKYLETYPGIKEYMKKEIEEAKNSGYVKTLFGRTRIIEELNNKNYMIRSMGERMALNTPIQGTAADILKMAMIKIYNEFKNKDLKSKMVIQVHDELVFDVLESEFDCVRNTIKDVMENIYQLSVPLKVEIEYGKNWYQAK